MSAGAEQGRRSRGATVGRVLRDGSVRSALVAGVVIGGSAAFAGPRYPWQYAIIGAVWLVATIVRIRNVVIAPPPETPPSEQTTPAPASAPPAEAERHLDPAPSSTDDPAPRD